MVKTKASDDYWEVKGKQLIRHHVTPRMTLYTPANTEMPEGVKRKRLAKRRLTKAKFVDHAGEISVDDSPDIRGHFSPSSLTLSHSLGYDCTRQWPGKRFPTQRGCAACCLGASPACRERWPSNRLWMGK